MPSVLRSVIRTIVRYVNLLSLTLLLPRAYIYTPTLNFLGLPRAYIYPRVEKRLYNRMLQSVAYQAVSTTLPDACSSGFVHWFPVWYFLQPRIFTQVPKHGPQG